MHRTRSGDALIAFVVGGVVGAAAALMLAPATGSETRRRLREAGGKTANRTRGAFDGARRVAAEQAHRVGRALEEGREEGPAAFAQHAGDRDTRWDTRARDLEVTPDEPGAA